jgi:hypothetical protein
VRCRLSALLLLTVVASGCAGSPAPVSPTPSAPGVPGAGRVVTLTCADAGSGTLGDGTGPALAVGALTFEGLRATVPDVPRATDVGLRVPAELAGWRFRKVPVYVTARAPSVTLRLDPEIAAAFAWVPARSWTSGEPDLTRWAAASVSFASCPDRTATYFGGLLADAAGTCIRFRVGDAGPRRVSTRLDGRGCPG